MQTTFPFKPGDIFFVGGGGWLNDTINFFQARFSQDGVTRYSHTGVVTTPQGDTFETTSWRTGYQNMADTYAGSDIAILRWSSMTDEKASAGYRAVMDQKGRIYPYWRLLMHIVRLHGVVHFRSMECSVLVAHFLKRTGFSLKESNLWLYDVEKLHDELLSNPNNGWQTVFTGSLRSSGFIL